MRTEKIKYKKYQTLEQDNPYNPPEFDHLSVGEKMKLINMNEVARVESDLTPKECIEFAMSCIKDYRGGRPAKV